MAAKKRVKTKTSHSKILNKSRNKLAKRGKLNKKKPKDHQNAEPNRAHKHQDHEDSDDEQTMQDEDDDDLIHDSSFAVSAQKLTNSGVSRKRKQRELDKAETAFELAPRKIFANGLNKNMKMLLPIKSKGRVIVQMIEEDADEEEPTPEDDQISNNIQSESPEPESAKPLPPLSKVELFANRQHKIAERKTRIAVLASSLIESPEENIKNMKELRLMLDEADPDISITIRKLVMVSLTEVFKDTVPGYRIRPLSDKEKNTKVKKETKTLHDFEESFLRNYKHFLEFLETTVKGKSPKVHSKHKTKSPPVILQPVKATLDLSILAVKCICQMLVNHPHFNYRNNVLNILVALMTHGREEIAECVCNAIRTVFQRDKAGDVTLEIVRLISRLIKARKFGIKRKVLDTFLSLKIKEIDKSTPQERREAKQLLEKLSRKDRKRQKKMKMLEKELLETKATEDQKKKLKLHTEIVQAVFLSYFRILKLNTKSVLIPSVLEGLAKFAHLINVDFFDDLFTVFIGLIDAKVLTYRESLHLVQTAFIILSGQGSALKVDPTRFYRHLYMTLFNLHAGTTYEDVPLVLECLDAMISKRKREMSQQRLLAFIKRLNTLCLQLLPESVVGVLAVNRSLIQGYPQSEQLFDNELTGSGAYLPDMDDPEYCNAHNTTLWELDYLQKHYHPTVQGYAMHISKQAPSVGDGQLALKLARKTPLELYQELDHGAMMFSNKLPAKPSKPQKKKYSREFIQEDFKDYVNGILNQQERCIWT